MTRVLVPVAMWSSSSHYPRWGASGSSPRVLVLVIRASTKTDHVGNGSVWDIERVVRQIGEVCCVDGGDVAEQKVVLLLTKSSRKSMFAPVVSPWSKSAPSS